MKTRGNTPTTIGWGVIAGLALTLALAPSVAVATPAGAENLDNAQQQSQQDSILACATTTTTATTLGEELLDGRSDMETVQYPSQSPSMSMPCSDAFSNARGSYTSLMAPCVVTFHNGDIEIDAEDDDDSGSSGENVQRHHHKDASSPSLVSTYYHGTSSVCGTENTIGEAKQYVSAWPDECVGDFARCYDLKDPNHLLCPALQNLLEGLRHRRRLEEASVSASTVGGGGGAPPPPLEHTALVPPKTTHISIDCTIDREALIKSYEQQVQAQAHSYTHDRTGYQENAFFAVVLVLVAVLIVVFAVSHLVVQPIVGAIGEASGSKYFFRHSEHCPGDGENQRVSLVTRIEIDGGGNIDGDIDGDDDFGHEGADHRTHLDLAPDEMETISDPIHHQQHHQQHEIQVIPIDYDAVPLVPVTILSDEVIHAEVVQDGVIYYP